MSKIQKSAEMVLGTAQLGRPDGASAAAARMIVQAATRAGIRWIETASEYGASEQRIGQALQASAGTRIVTKLPPIATGTPSSAIRGLISDSVHNSCSRLNTNRLDVALVHHVNQLKCYNGLVWRTLRELRDEGIVFDLGVSVASPQDALLALANADVRYIQLQFNALEWRWQQSGVIDALATRSNITLHAHSALMHGLLAATPGARWPSASSIDPDQLRAQLWTLARDLDRDCPADLCIAYVRAQPWINGVIAGAKNPDQFALNLARFQRPALTAAEVAQVNAVLPRVTNELLDPAHWTRAA